MNYTCKVRILTIKIDFLILTFILLEISFVTSLTKPFLSIPDSLNTALYSL